MLISACSSYRRTPSNSAAHLAASARFFTCKIKNQTLVHCHIQDEYSEYTKILEAQRKKLDEYLEWYRENPVLKLSKLKKENSQEYDRIMALKPKPTVFSMQFRPVYTAGKKYMRSVTNPALLSEPYKNFVPASKTMLDPRINSEDCISDAHCDSDNNACNQFSTHHNAQKTSISSEKTSSSCSSKSEMNIPEGNDNKTAENTSSIIAQQSTRKTDKKINLFMPEFELVNRGGKITYHGPGQLVMYFILDLKDFSNLDIRKYISLLESTLKSFTESQKLTCVNHQDEVGVFIKSERDGKTKKLASIGINLQKLVTTHGVSINVCNNLEYLNTFEMCGLGDMKQSSFFNETGRFLDAESVAKEVVTRLNSELGNLEIDYRKVTENDL